MSNPSLPSPYTLYRPFPMSFASFAPLPNTALVIFLPWSVIIPSVLRILTDEFPFTNIPFAIRLLFFRSVRYLAQTPSFLLLMLSAAMSIPKTKLSLAIFHLGISPPLPTAKSIMLLPGFDTFVISIFFT